MSIHRVETTVTSDGTLTLTDLPFHAGDAVEVLIVPRIAKPIGQERYPLHGKAIQYVNPTDSVAEEDWAALQ